MSIFLAWYILVEEDFLNLKTSSKYGVHVLLFEIIRVKYGLFLIYSYILRKSSKFIRWEFKKIVSQRMQNVIWYIV